MKKRIKVGIIHSLQGTMSFSESPLVDAALMAFDEINSSGGVLGAMTSPVVEDCAANAETYAVKTARLIKRKGIKHFFGCWTSASRKAVQPVVETHDALLWYPVQYEGLEESPNIVYTGNYLNQQIEPAVKWAAKNMGSKCYMVGSDYVFPRTANMLIRTLCQKHGVQVLGEHYLPLGAENFERIVNRRDFGDQDDAMHALQYKKGLCIRTAQSCQKSKFRVAAYLIPPLLRKRPFPSLFWQRFQPR
jgi:urea transport system substrate-binding protein